MVLIHFSLKMVLVGDLLCKVEARAPKKKKKNYSFNEQELKLFSVSGPWSTMHEFSVVR